MCSRLQVLSKTLKFQIRDMGRLRPRLSIFYDKKQPFSVNVFQAKVCTHILVQLQAHFVRSLEIPAKTTVLYVFSEEVIRKPQHQKKLPTFSHFFQSREMVQFQLKTESDAMFNLPPNMLSVSMFTL